MPTLTGGERKSCECPHCGNSFVAIGSHWAQSQTCDHPEYTDRQTELIRGLLMGDGSLSNQGGGEYSLVVSSTNTEFLLWIDREFGPHSSGVRLVKTGDEQAEYARSSGFDSSGGEWEYDDVYHVLIRGHPTLTQLRRLWYPDGSIRFPNDLSLTPTTAKMWYCSDGGLSWADSRFAYVAFGTHNEADRPEYLLRLFERHGFSPSWSEPLIRFPVDETPDVLSWIGEPVDGMEYKWCYDDRDEYDALVPWSDS